MKYESVTKRARNELLYEYYLAHRELSLKEIGVIFGISKQRVSKIIKREKELAGVSMKPKTIGYTERGSGGAKPTEPASKE